jgi:hypothetical protein
LRTLYVICNTTTAMHFNGECMSRLRQQEPAYITPTQKVQTAM